MAERGVGLLRETQRQPAGQPLRLGKVVARGLSMAGGQAVGEIEIALAQGPANLQLALEPPQIRPPDDLRRIEQDLDHALVEPLLPPPAHSIEDQAGVAAQFRGHRLDRLVHPVLAPLQTHPGLGKPPVAVGHQREHAVRRRAAIVPQQIVQARDVIGGAEHAPVLLQKALLLACREVALDPRLADQLLTALLLVDVEQRLGIADVAPRGQRQAGGEQLAYQGMVGGIGDRVLRDQLQLFGQRPVRITDQELRDDREIGGLAVLDHAQPAHGLGRERIADQRRQAQGTLPLLAPGRLKGLAQDRLALGIDSLHRCAG